MSARPDDIASVIVTEQLAQRSPLPPDYLREKLALQDLANQMADHPSEVLPRLVNLAMDMCDADSAGISVLEPEGKEFRWFALHGSLSVFEGARTPRNFSPCGVTLNQNAPVLMKNPERVYDWIRDAKIVVPEVLLVPLYVRHADAVTPLGTLWVVARDGGQFDSGHARELTELASFAGVALRMILTEEKLLAALKQQEQLTEEMAHRIKNLFAITDAMIRMTARNSESKEEMAEKLVGRLHALSAANGLIKQSFSDARPAGPGLVQAIEAIMKPYDGSNATGPDIVLGTRATNSIALIFHELATNAAKYGSLSNADGTVDVSWHVDGDTLKMIWREQGGPDVAEPAKKGFGGVLIESTIRSHDGTVAYEWQASGLVASVNFPIHALAH
jgi:two-component sensor histidine kinase